jgi:hypothetical protein
MIHRCAALALCWMTIGLMVGCAAGPSPIVIYEDKRDSIWLKFDPKAGAGHSHPASISPGQMAKILRGVWVVDRDRVVGFGLLSDNERIPVFSEGSVMPLAAYLSQALAKASPKDMATFYVTTFEAGRGKLITSGGLFVRDQRLHFILANAHTSPSSVQYENTYEFDNRSEPLLPIARWKFKAGFSPREALIPNSQVRGTDEYRRYLDEAKLLVIDLPRLDEVSKTISSTTDHR